MKKGILSLAVTILFFTQVSPSFAVESLTCWFPPGWKSKPGQAQNIVKALSEKSETTINPRIAKSYPEILRAFASGKPSLVYVGSFVQTIIHARDIGAPLVQNINGKEFYSGVLIYPKGQDPAAILNNFPEKIAFAAGASSGESTAKAATNGKASIKTPNHVASVGAVKSGRAKAGVVKNWWWEANNGRYPGLEMYAIPGISEQKNPDNVLTASKSVPADVQKKITDAALQSKALFGATEMVPFDTHNIEFSLDLMEKGKIDPMTYNWN
ncbi:hypothetical protein DSCA_29440 [Desulfosarcina alkanivorans]|uniref:Phosphonate ABC transporter substrate-binding protein n=1 Tax=Desulfosarcina alkanivorans TaxID=571177 RepID=A0A5K7YRV1_9BACT|nr:PhnD/SsuA/transferrin family substrate-binding protein [Desulfosarcina alkanivorans]BBO69014.1 hypothetical protein DSCA_29440 [Desulfosarcina alkanivorans]